MKLLVFIVYIQHDIITWFFYQLLDVNWTQFVETSLAAYIALLIFTRLGFGYNYKFKVK